ncbi:hypothetical protein BdWA1_003317 [Babesia duncani]|uniref:Uncharacterized protein n=1 Tax=Babesia duncani TaxID=323732 RepID=A0AAD9PIV0_9APIC|nr:hypothetical protein BdWA1_003317 [Babesia duncani]
MTLSLVGFVNIVRAEDKIVVSCVQHEGGNSTPLHVCTAYIENDKDYLLFCGAVAGAGNYDVQEISNTVAAAAAPVDLVSAGITITFDKADDPIFVLRKNEVVNQEETTLYLTCKRAGTSVNLNENSLIWRLIYIPGHGSNRPADRVHTISASTPALRPYLFMEPIKYGERLTIACPPNGAAPVAVIPSQTSVYAVPIKSQYSNNTDPSFVSNAVAFEDASLSYDTAAGQVTWDLSNVTAFVDEGKGQHFYYFYCQDPAVADIAASGLPGVVVYIEDGTFGQKGCDPDGNLFTNQMEKMNYNRACVANGHVDKTVKFRCKHTLVPPMCGLGKTEQRSRNSLFFSITENHGTYDVSLLATAPNEGAVMGCLCIDNGEVRARLHYSTYKADFIEKFDEVYISKSIHPGTAVSMRCPINSIYQNRLDYLEAQPIKDQSAIDREQFVDYTQLKSQAYGEWTLLWADAEGSNFIKMQNFTLHCVPDPLNNPDGKLKRLVLNLEYQPLNPKNVGMWMINARYANSVSLYQYEITTAGDGRIDCRNFPSIVSGTPDLNVLHPLQPDLYYFDLPNMDITDNTLTVTSSDAYKSLGLTVVDGRPGAPTISYNISDLGAHAANFSRAPIYLVCSDAPLATAMGGAVNVDRMMVIVRIVTDLWRFKDACGKFYNTIPPERYHCDVRVTDKKIFGFACVGLNHHLSTCLDKFESKAKGQGDSPIKVIITGGLYSFDFSSVESVEEDITCKCMEGDDIVGSFTLKAHGNPAKEPEEPVVDPLHSEVDPKEPKEPLDSNPMGNPTEPMVDPLDKPKEPVDSGGKAHTCSIVMIGISLVISIM